MTAPNGSSPALPASRASSNARRSRTSSFTSTDEIIAAMSNSGRAQATPHPQGEALKSQHDAWGATELCGMKREALLSPPGHFRANGTSPPRGHRLRGRYRRRRWLPNTSRTVRRMRRGSTYATSVFDYSPWPCAQHSSPRAPSGQHPIAGNSWPPRQFYRQLRPQRPQMADPPARRPSRRRKRRGARNQRLGPSLPSPHGDRNVVVEAYEFVAKFRSCLVQCSSDGIAACEQGIARVP